MTRLNSLIFATALLLLFLSGCSILSYKDKNLDQTSIIISDPITTSSTTATSPTAQTTTESETTTAITTDVVTETTSPIQIDKSRRIVIAALGDSLTEGTGVDTEDNYPSQLEKELISQGYNARVLNSGISSELSAQTKGRVDEVIEEQPDIVILTIGANDARAYLDPITVKSNIRTMITEFKSNDITVILGGMQILGDMNITQAAEFLVERLGIPYEYAIQIAQTANYVDNFKRIYPELASEENISFIPFFLNGVEGRSEYNIQDGLHPNKEGYSIIVKNNILPVLLPVIEQKLSLEQMQ